MCGVGISVGEGNFSKVIEFVVRSEELCCRWRRDRRMAGVRDRLGGEGSRPRVTRRLSPLSQGGGQWAAVFNQLLCAKGCQQN